MNQSLLMTSKEATVLCQLSQKKIRAPEEGMCGTRWHESAVKKMLHYKGKCMKFMIEITWGKI